MDFTSIKHGQSINFLFYFIYYYNAISWRVASLSIFDQWFIFIYLLFFVGPLINDFSSNWIQLSEVLSRLKQQHHPHFFFPLCFGQITVQFLSLSKVFLIIANIAILKKVMIRLQYFYNNILQTKFFFNNIMCKNNLLLKFYC